ncbi:MAG: LPS translocon maturation chaperone LptM [Acidiferrobacteraceae bacterium]
MAGNSIASARLSACVRLLVVFGLVILAGCGRNGALYLPQKPSAPPAQAVVTSRSPPASPATHSTP